jgi:hypothetical protein
MRLPPEERFYLVRGYRITPAPRVSLVPFDCELYIHPPHPRGAGRESRMVFASASQRHRLPKNFSMWNTIRRGAPWHMWRTVTAEVGNPNRSKLTQSLVDLNVAPLLADHTPLFHCRSRVAHIPALEEWRPSRRCNRWRDITPSPATAPPKLRKNVLEGLLRAALVELVPPSPAATITVLSALLPD